MALGSGYDMAQNCCRRMPWQNYRSWSASTSVSQKPLEQSHSIGAADDSRVARSSVMIYA